MITKQDVRSRAVVMGIASGQMPNADLIWAIQREDLHTECFGRIDGCNNWECRWHAQCTALNAIQDTTLNFEVFGRKQSA